MSATTNTKTNTSNIAVRDIEYKYLQLGENKTKKYMFDEPDNSGEYTLKEGMAVGVEQTTGKIKILDATATDGTQFPVGFVARDKTMAAGATDVEITVVTGGRINKSMVDLNGQNFDDKIQNPTNYNRNIEEEIETFCQLLSPDSIDAFNS